MFNLTLKNVLTMILQDWKARLLTILFLALASGCAPALPMERGSCNGQTNNAIVGNYVADDGSTLYLNTNCEGKASKCALDFEYSPLPDFNGAPWEKSGTVTLKVFGSANGAGCPANGVESACSYTFTETEFTLDCGAGATLYHKTALHIIQ